MVRGPTHSYTCGVLSCVLRFKSKLGGNELLNADALPPGLPLGFLGRPQRTARPFGDFDRDEDGVSSSGLSHSCQIWFTLRIVLLCISCILRIG